MAGNKMQNNTYQSLLKQSLSYHPLYGNGLSNHLPMVLLALHQMGASNQQLSNFFEHYRPKLEPLQQTKTSCKLQSLESKLGNPNCLQEFISHYQYEIQHTGQAQTLKQALPILIPGLAASAFHAMIRLAYAIEANNEPDIALSLAYWASESQPFHLNTTTADESLSEILKRLVTDWEIHLSSSGTISQRMNEVARSLRQKHSHVQPLNMDLKTLAEFSIDTYAKQNNFTLLHSVTGCHAFRIISPYLNDTNRALRYLWEAFLIAYLSTGLTPSNAKPTYSQALEDWESIQRDACGSDNDHTIKLIYSCWQENIFYENPDYYHVAQLTR